jgi:hypothetical protein
LEALNAGMTPASCWDIPADCRSSRRSPGSGRGKKCADTPFVSFAEPIAIAERILPILVFKVLSQGVQGHYANSPTQACRRRMQSYIGGIQFL